MIVTSPYPDVALSDRTITERVFAGIDPEATILIDGLSGRSLTGAQFMASVKSLAGGLTERGYAPGGCVALMAPNMPEFCVAFHGAVWAGGTVTTINPTYPAPEVNHQLRDAGADLLITVAPLADIAKAAIKGTRVRDIVIIGDAPDGTIPLSDMMGTPLAAQAPVDVANHVAVLPYSSGTTGLPKGVMLTHRNLVVNIDQVLAASQPDPGEATVSFLPFFHIYGLQILMNVNLAASGCTITMPRFDLEQYLTLCCRYKTPRLWIVPPVALALAKHPLVDRFDLSFLTQVNSAAAPLGADVAQALAARLGTAVTQGYGMTELSPGSHISRPPFAVAGASGRTAPNTQCRIVDPETGKDLPKGQDGELWVKGPQVMKGYLNNPKATAETIVEDGWLRTGDIAHFDDNGYLFVTDRLKELIKVKGFQVAPAELEALLLTHPDITDVAVIGVSDPESGEIPMAFIVSRTPPDLHDIRTFLEPQIAPYKHIQRLEIVAEIPKSASGKILRRLLRDQIKASG
ncbi:AMP-binding protein [Pararhodobacter sp.]|uniref:AMP-binding protein n=1 Tax=Pararhodobacter sp. TaxID=2127056 RepID=UPI002AFE08C4|nr:AMP-binding protein [Pararhodobacter sp.]